MKSAALAPGRVLGRYELLLPVARGGMAEVWAARLHGSRGFQRVVALKTIVSGTMDDVQMEQMFLQEASLASRIQHPNVAATLDLGEEDGNLYMVMEWVDGEPLSLILQQGFQRKPMPLEIAVNLIGQACLGLHAAHELRDEHGVPLGIVHRDISPQNVLVTHSGTVKLVDFGIAKATNVVTGRTSTGEVKGKFAYMAPEQVRGEPVDRRTDIFAIGILLYVVSTGRHPYKKGTTAHTINQLCSKDPVIPPSAFIANYPRALEEVVIRALNKDKSRRFVDARELFEELARALPEAFRAGFEAGVAQYLEELLGERASESRTRLRLAQQALDAMPKESGTPATKQEPGSVGSIRAVSINAPAPSAPVAAPSETHATLASAPNRGVRPSSRPPSRTRLKLLLSAAALATLATLGAPRFLPWLSSHLNEPRLQQPASFGAQQPAPLPTSPNSQSRPAVTAQAQAPEPAAAAGADTVFAPERIAVGSPRTERRRPARGPASRPNKTAPAAPPPADTAPPPRAADTAAAPPRAPEPIKHDPLEKRY